MPQLPSGFIRKMTAISPLKIPPSVSNASREDLEKLLVGTLKKLKARDQQIAELSVAASSQDSKESGRAEEDVAKKCKELETVVESLQSKLIAAEQRYQERLQAETDLLQEGFKEERQRAQSLSEGNVKSLKEMIVDFESKNTRQEAEIERLEGILRRHEEERKENNEQIDSSEQERVDLANQIETLRKEKGLLIEKITALEESEAKKVDKTVLGHVENELALTKKDLHDAKQKAADAGQEILSLKQSLEHMHQEETKRLLNEISELKSALEQAKNDFETDSAAPSPPQKIEFDASKFVTVEDYKILQDEIAEMKKKFAVTLKKKQLEAEKKIQDLQEQLKATVPGSVSGSEDVAKIRKEVEIERGRFKKALGELKRRNEVLTKSKEDVERQCGELKVAIDMLKADVSAESRRAREAQSLAEQSSAAFKEYKQRAHSLLKSKDDELKEGRFAAKEEFEREIDAARKEQGKLTLELQQASEELEKLKSQMAEQVYTVEQKYEDRITDLEKDLKNSKECTKAATRQYEQLRVRFESYDDRYQSLKTQLEESQREVLEAKSAYSASSISASEYENMKASLSRVEKEKRGLEEVKAVMEGEIADLKAMVKQLKMTLAVKSSLPKSEMHEYVDRGTFNGPIGMPFSNSNGSLSGGEINSERLRQVELDLAAANRKASAAEQEIDDLEKEVSLRHAQEVALKETVRELERELERVKLTSKGVDMEYFKNILLKLFETGEEESLLPVIATMLQFSPAERQRCQDAMEGRKEQSALLPTEASANVTSYITDLFGFGASEEQE